MNLHDYYQRTFIKDLKVDSKVTRVCVTGVVVSYKVKEKFVNFTIDDNTGMVLCLHFKFPSEKNPFLVGTIVTVLGEYEVNRFLNEVEYRVKVQRYSIVKDVNEELYCYLETFLQKQIKASDAIKVEQENNGFQTSNGFQTPGKSPAKGSKRVPLSKESIHLKLRTLIFRCLKEHLTCALTQENNDINRVRSQARYFLTFMDIFSYKPLVEFMEKENVSGKDDLSKAIIDMERLMVIKPVDFHSQEEYEGVKYEVNIEKVHGIKATILEYIKEAGSLGIRLEDLFKQINFLYSTQTFVLSKEFLWQICNELFNENKVYLSKKDVFHYLEQLY